MSHLEVASAPVTLTKAAATEPKNDRELTWFKAHHAACDWLFPDDSLAKQVISATVPEAQIPLPSSPSGEQSVHTSHQVTETPVSEHRSETPLPPSSGDRKSIPTSPKVKNTAGSEHNSTTPLSASSSRQESVHTGSQAKDAPTPEPKAEIYIPSMPDDRESTRTNSLSKDAPTPVLESPPLERLPPLGGNDGTESHGLSERPSNSSPSLIFQSNASSASDDGQGASQNLSKASVQSPTDEKAPLPTSLLAIEAFFSTEKETGERKEKRSKYSWSVSGFESVKLNNEALDIEVSTEDIIPQSYTSVPYNSASTSPKAVSQGEVKPGTNFTPNESFESIVGDWVMELEDAPISQAYIDSFDNPVIYGCDLDTVTGKFLPPVQQPETLFNLAPGPCNEYDDINWRQANMTAELQMAREAKSRRIAADNIRNRLALRSKQETLVPEEEEPWPSADCILRPAKPADFERIAEIINLESQVENCPQVLQTVTVSDITELYHRCQKSLRPFIVATLLHADGALDITKWPKGSEKIFEEFTRYKMSQPGFSLAPAVVGFAFVDEMRFGFLGTHCPGSRYIAQLRLGVDPDHRRKGYGTALVDRILGSVAPYHQGVIDYKWECPQPAHIYECPPSNNVRQYAWLFLEVFFQFDKKDKKSWQVNWLRKLHFRKAAYFEDILKTDRSYDSQWLDLSLWKLEVQHLDDIADDKSVLKGPHH